MRLRQAHAITTTLAALEATFPDQVTASPTEHDDPSMAIVIDDDELMGCIECNDPDKPDRDTRAHSFSLVPGPGEFDITVEMWEGFPLWNPRVLIEQFTVWQLGTDNDPELTGKPGQQIADTITAKVRELEAPHVAAYNARATSRG
ncbi:hypothetical protein KCMC57_63710 (plasmid) [Kitasatospora sp. CMC57]|uniref:Uncharacterized protein n=1 Tax=Kitasatospora sp. CMC57 TaxID=3231513 RepID=A0AB33K8K0_9ACTN